MWITIRKLCAAVFQKLDDIERRRLAYVVDIVLVAEFEYADTDAFTAVQY